MITQFYFLILCVIYIIQTFMNFIHVPIFLNFGKLYSGTCKHTCIFLENWKEKTFLDKQTIFFSHILTWLPPFNGFLNLRVLLFMLKSRIQRIELNLLGLYQVINNCSFLTIVPIMLLKDKSRCMRGRLTETFTFLVNRRE